jgi:PhoH-like ATPase
MPLPPAPTQRASTLQAQIKVSTEKTFKPAEKKATSGKAPDLFSVSHVKNKSLADESATDFSVNIHQALKLNPLGESSVSEPKSKKKKKSSASGPAKLFVLDTNVLMHDPMCLFRFEEHDIFLPMIVLEELDSNKKGMTEVARNARQTSRTLDALVGLKDSDISQGISLNGTGHSDVGGKLFFQTKPLEYSLPTSLPQGKADNQILGVVQALGKLY